MKNQMSRKKEPMVDGTWENGIESSAGNAATLNEVNKQPRIKPLKENSQSQVMSFLIYRQNVFIYLPDRSIWGENIYTF